MKSLRKNSEHLAQIFSELKIRNQNRKEFFTNSKQVFPEGEKKRFFTPSGFFFGRKRRDHRFISSATASRRFGGLPQESFVKGKEQADKPCTAIFPSDMPIFQTCKNAGTGGQICVISLRRSKKQRIRAAVKTRLPK